MERINKDFNFLSKWFFGNASIKDYQDYFKWIKPYSDLYDFSSQGWHAYSN